ncbi:unnamed protein product [Mycena citricolor]|uniref:Uncharacterized protein n=1 Tax=Mycena citricolor TaxID=2018698 RepID=A0AAD2H846_9AGAR|nr:unnamed protein product [Mycena citricolor]
MFVDRERIPSASITTTGHSNIYLQLLSGFHKLDQIHAIDEGFDSRWRYALVMAEHDYKNDEIELLSGLQDLHTVDGYLGGVNNGRGMGVYLAWLLPFPMRSFIPIDPHHHQTLRALLNDIEPQVDPAEEEDGPEEYFAWFSDEEEVAGGDEW